MTTGETSELIRRAGRDRDEALGQLLDRHAGRLRCMLNLRMDRRLKGRVDASDVWQETCVEAAARFDDFLQHRSMPFFVWLRFLAGQKLMQLHRHHLGFQMRDARREVSLHRGAFPEATSDMLAAHLVGADTSPSQAAVRGEVQWQLQQALDSMDELDREILALRHFEQLTNSEAAHELDIPESTASSRHLRALGRLRSILSRLPDFWQLAGQSSQGP